MRTARLTVLMKPDEKAAIEARAAARGVSSGEFVRLAVDNFGKLSEEDEAELEALTRELEATIPKIHASLDSMENSIGQARAAIRKCLKQVARAG